MGPSGHVGGSRRSHAGALSSEPELRQLRRARVSATVDQIGHGLARWNGQSKPHTMAAVAGRGVAGRDAGDDVGRRRFWALEGIDGAAC